MSKLTICTPPEDKQCWTKSFLKQIRDEHNIIFDGKGCLAVRIIPNPDSDYPSLSIMIQDDGMLFESKTKVSMYWVDELIELLEEAKKYWKEKSGDME